MLDAVSPPSLIRRPAAADGFAWRTRVVPGGRTPTGLTLAIDVHGRVEWAPRGDRRAIRVRTLEVCVELARIALKDGFLVEVLPSGPADDPLDARWICAARLCLSLKVACKSRAEADHGAALSARPDPSQSFAGRDAPRP